MTTAGEIPHPQNDGRRRSDAQSSPTEGQGRTVNLGRGMVVPYPTPMDEAATKVAKANRRRDTRCEVRLRSALHHRGLRFRREHLLRAGDVKVRADIVFTRLRIVVLVDGCFWHGCPDHQRVPMRNRDYWVPKLRANVERDRRVDAALRADGWTVVRVWEHETVEAATTLVLNLVRGRTVDERS